MLQECNKFREHQAREVLIELMEKQLKERRSLLKELQLDIARADELLGGQDLVDQFMEESS
jgi:MED7 protein